MIRLKSNRDKTPVNKPAKILKLLGRIDILRALPAEEIQALIPNVERLVYPVKSVLMNQGDAGDCLYFIEKGTALINRKGIAEIAPVEAGSVVGEMALLTGESRNATVVAKTELTVWKIGKQSFDDIVNRSPTLKKALEELVEARRTGIIRPLPKTDQWVATALRAIEARYSGLRLWQFFMGLGLGMWLFSFTVEFFHLIKLKEYHGFNATFQLIAGLLILQGSCESFIDGVERLGARLKWDGFISGTVGSILSTLPEFVVIAFLVSIDPLAAFVTAVVTIFNNSLAFSIYSFFLPKDREGSFAMPRSMTRAGGEILIAGAAISIIVGIVMVIVRLENARTLLAGFDLLVIGAVLMAIYGYYTLTLVRYYGEGKDSDDSVPPDPEKLGHNTNWRGIVILFFLGTVGAYCGGESIGAFAETALKQIGLPTIPTAAGLAFFAGISEYVIVYKSHRRGELGIALSNVFGGLTQVMFLLLPFSLLAIGLLGMATGNPLYVVPVNMATTLLIFLLFPLFYTLHQYLEQDKSVSNLDAAAMTGIYILLLYFLFTFPE